MNFLQNTKIISPVKAFEKVLIVKNDERKNEVHTKDSNGLEKWFDYDKYGNLIHFKDTKGAESIYIEGFQSVLLQATENQST